MLPKDVHERQAASASELGRPLHALFGRHVTLSLNHYAKAHTRTGLRRPGPETSWRGVRQVSGAPSEAGGGRRRECEPELTGLPTDLLGFC